MADSIHPSSETPQFLETERVQDSDSDLQDTLLRKAAEKLSKAPMPLPGDRLGGLSGHRYEILETLGGGGMGRIFRALDHELQRTVALKFLLPSARHTSVKGVSLLREEAQAIARLDHENIVRVHDVSEWSPLLAKDGPLVPMKVPFLVMEYLEGEPLHALLQRERPGLRRTFEIMTDVAKGLAHAHERGLVHRDLKPSNVFLLAHGKTKLLDFGLAWLLADASPTPSMAGVGTPAYMAPEQWRGEPPDTRADIWAAGLLLFELLTGERPFPKMGSRDFQARITSEEPMPSVRERCPELPEEVVRLVASSLAKNPLERPATGATLLQRLSELEERLGLRPQHSQADHAERRQVTLLSCSLSLATGPGRPLALDDPSEVEAAFHRACARIIHQHGGNVTTCVGTEVLACFGHPITREDDAARAVHAALCLKESLPRELRILGEQGLSVKTGLHTGLVSMDDTAPELQGVAAAIQGEAPRVASWLATQAEPNTILLSDRTYALVRGHFETRFLGQRAFAGLLGPRQVSLHHVLGARRLVSRFDRSLVVGSLTPLVGRERELRRLLALRSEALHGRGVFILLRGEAGIGKSRLLQELHNRDTRRSSIWVRCQCWPQFKNTAFHPLTNWLHRCLGFSPDALPEEKQRRLEEQLAQQGLSSEHVSALASILSLHVAEEPAFRQLASEHQREKILSALLAFIQAQAARQPLVLVVEDLHWADPSTLQFLKFLLAHVEKLGACVLLTARTEWEHSWSGRPSVHLLELNPLSPECTVAMLREASRGRPLSAEGLKQLANLTDGIPLFIEELTRAVLEQEGRAGASPEITPVAIPPTLHELLRARLDQLPPRRKALVQLAATLGREFSYELFRAIAFLDERELLRELDQLEQAGFLFRQGHPPYTMYTFKHTLIQNAAYQSLLRSTRQRYHARTVHVLSEQFPDMAEDQPELLAQHSTRAGLVELAVNQWRQAGQHAAAQSAFAEAISHFHRALEQLALLPASPERDNLEITLRAELGQALVTSRGFSSQEVEKEYTRARQLCEQFGDVPLSVLWGIWVVVLVRADPEGSDHLAAHFRRQLEKREDPAALTVLHSALGSLAFWRGEYTLCKQHCLQAKTLFDSQGVSELLFQIRGSSQSHVSEQMLYAYLYLAFSEVMLGHADRARETYAEALEHAEATRHPYAIATALIFGTAIAREAGAPEEALEASHRAMALSTEHGIPITLAIGNCINGWATAQLGDMGEGIARLQEGLSLLRSMGALLVYPYYLGYLASLYLATGQIGEGLTSVEAGLESAEKHRVRNSVPELRRIQGELMLRQGEEAAGRAHLEQALMQARALGAKLHELRAAVSLGRFMTHAGEKEAARALITEALSGVAEGSGLADFKAAQRFLAEFLDLPPLPSG
ncbi:adenylate/guanylate cyclase [Stigmatella aurantiaca]|uniref:Adenylate/guanylate cyclase n=1 Tax=Stigmatella aurantiaca TaxID=41 RepID=A0A1H7WZU7_STIAU|nr:protein kinase [Stigmatella aurantiaca]SEM26358.1 adenylate/guanylate cyclase [Stigmatella aurantiaca]